MLTLSEYHPVSLPNFQFTSKLSKEDLHKYFTSSEILNTTSQQNVVLSQLQGNFI